MNYTNPELSKSALVTIDTQCDFSLPGASAKIQGTFDVIPNMRSLLAAYRRSSLLVVHIVRLYLPNGANADLCRREMIESGARFVAPGTNGAELMSDLKPVPDLTLDADLLLKRMFTT
jgi:nicotinamidase-related amidase